MSTERIPSSIKGIAIPKAIEQIYIKRSEYNDTVYVAMKSGLWEAKFSTPESNLHQRINEITEAMEKVK